MNLGTVVTNGQPFLQGNIWLLSTPLGIPTQANLRPHPSLILWDHSLTSGVKRSGCYAVPNGRSVYTFLKWKETVICMGERNGTVASEQALRRIGKQGEERFSGRREILGRALERPLVRPRSVGL